MASPNFDLIIAATLEHEGGYSFDPADPGGETKYGISRRSYPNRDIKGLTLATAKSIYLRDFWHAPGFDRIDDHELARKVFDLGVNCGTHTAAKMLQRAINTVCDAGLWPRRRAAWRQKVARLLGGAPIRVDGIIGPITAQVIRSCPHKRALLAALKGEAYNHYRNLNPLYIPGWLQRLES